jgi:septin 3/9/12
LENQVFSVVLNYSGLGKSTLVNSIFASHLTNSQVKSFDNTKTTEISISSHTIVENNVAVKLSIIDTPG